VRAYGEVSEKRHHHLKCMAIIYAWTCERKEEETSVDTNIDIAAGDLI